VRQWALAEGSFFSDADVASAAKVCVLGQTVIANLFHDTDPIGQTVLIKNVPFTVVGTLVARGQTGVGQDQDDTVVVPYTSALQRLTGGTFVSEMMVSGDNSADTTVVQAEITTLLEQRHRITDGQDDFQVRNLADIASAATASATVMEYLLASVAAVSLVVGGIGIMNIMLVSVTERTREIGLRMAVGAPGSAILTQFLIEAVTLSLAGGAIGIVLGCAGTYVVSAFADWPTVISIESVVLAVVFSAVVGAFFGYYPALKASQLNPIEALSFE
jgi:putative ABC transport system permease protein